MATPAKKLLKQVNQEKSQACYIPYACQIDAETIETRSGMLLQVIQVEGIHVETKNDAEMLYQKELRNTLLKSIGSPSLGLQVITRRSKSKIKLSSAGLTGFAKALNDRWQAIQESKDYYVNEWYIAVFKKPPQGNVLSLIDLVNSISKNFNQRARDSYRQEQLKSLTKATDQIINTLHDYRCRRLTLVKAGDKHISEIQSFLYELINLEKRQLALVKQDLSSYLSSKRLFFDKQTGTVALRNNAHAVIYATIVSIKNYDPSSAPWVLDRLLDIPGELTICQSFLFLDKQVARKTLTDQQIKLRQSDDSIGTTSESINDARDDLSMGKTLLGKHHYTVLCQAASRQALDSLVGQIEAVLSGVGIIGVREDRGIEMAFWAQLPTNTAYIARRATISTVNFASFANFHNTYSGNCHKLHWGEPIVILETVSGAPYYFNFHVADVANTILIGPMGSGKTLLELFLVALSMRLGGHAVIFDKDRGAEIFVRSQGSYGVIAPGFQSGMNPTQMDESPTNRYHLSQLVKKILTLKGELLTESEEEKIHHAVNALFKIPKAMRRFRDLAPLLGIRKNGSIRARFDAWINDGEYAWVFDNDEDTLSFTHPLIGFDMTHVLDDPMIQAPIFMHIFFRIEQMLDGRRMRIVVAEGWKPLQDATFRAQIEDWSSTPRKKEAFMILDTQHVDQIASSPIGSQIVQGSATQIFFANPEADEEQYCGKFNLNQKEFNIIRSLDKRSHFFLLKQGGKSVVVRADLTGMTEQIAVLSGRAATVKILDSIRQEMGDDPHHWLPVFYQRVKSSKA